MAEIIQRGGVWAFDGSTIRIAPGAHRSAGLFRQTYGEVTVPIEAVSGVSFEQEGKRGRLRLTLREGSDPLLQATGGMLPVDSDPYRLPVDRQHTGAAEYVLEEIRQALLLDQVPKGRTDGYLLPGPAVPLTVQASDGAVSFDGSRVRIDWASTSSGSKKEENPRLVDLADLLSVEWLPKRGLDNGVLRFVTAESSLIKRSPKEDPWALDLWGSARRDLLTALVAAAVVARLPHPTLRPQATARPGLAQMLLDAARPAAPPRDDHHDVLLRRLRELGQLHREGVLTDEEFADVKAVVLRGFRDGEGGGGARGPGGTAAGGGREEPRDRPR
ncbi:DUF4429 domain-containing protein [Streptomyces sp. NPDC050560]|uniref:DUF4429 domain-containing protein n=1 Tax=Streptomyces sp. NPDC050560 TaxID=3365630 RepID=UPI0037BBE824